MKNKNVILIICLFLLNNLNAQTEISIKAGSGINNSSTIFKDIKSSEYDFFIAFDNSIAFSYSIGFNTNFLLNKKNKFAIDLLFIRKAFIYNLILSTENINDLHKYYFINIPVYWKHLFSGKTGMNFGFVNNFFLKNSYGLNEAMTYYNIGLTCGFYYCLNDKFILSADIQSDISPYFKYEGIGKYQLAYNYGAMLSLSYKIFEK